MIKPLIILNYLIKKNLLSILVIMFFCCFLFLTIDLIELLRRSSSKDVPIKVVLKITFLHLPTLFPIILPTVFLLSSMHTFMKLNKNSELNVMRSSGISIWFFLLPTIINCLILSSLYVFFFNPIFAKMLIKFKSYESTFFRGNAGLHTISPTGLWLRQINNDKEFVINASHYSPLDNKLQDVIVFEFDDKDAFQRRIDASEVRMIDDVWKMSEVSVVKINERPLVLKEMDLNLNLSIKKIEQNFRSADTISFWSLPSYINNLEKSGFTAKKHIVYYHYLLSFPLTLLSMVILGCSLSIKKSRKKRQYLNILIGIILGVFFHFLNDVLRTLGSSGTLPIFFAVWGIPLIFLSVLIGILIHIEDG